MAYSIFRPLSEAEKKDFVQVGQTNILDLFLKDLAKKKAEFQKKYRPFDSYCARIDFEENLRKKMGEISTMVDMTKANTQVEFGDLDAYGKPSRFDYVGSSKEKEEKLLDGMRQPTVVGVRYKFKGKIKGNRISIAVPNDDVEAMEKWISKTYKTTAKEEAKKEDTKKEEGDKE